jgi:hypothetical protein
MDALCEILIETGRDWKAKIQLGVIGSIRVGSSCCWLVGREITISNVPCQYRINDA